MNLFTKIGTGIAICSIVFFPMLGYAETGAALLLIPPKGTVTTGDQITVGVALASPDKAANAVAGSIIVPPSLSLVAIDTNTSIVNFWVEKPHPAGNMITFEGIVLNPGYTGSNGKLFTVTFSTKKIGHIGIAFREGEVLANDGIGTNILQILGTTTVIVQSWKGTPIVDTTSQTPALIEEGKKTSMLPVITGYIPIDASRASAQLTGQGEPDGLTKIEFEDIASKTLGEQLISFLQLRKQKLDTIFVHNDQTGSFRYVTPQNLLAGTYNAVPFWVDKTTREEKSGLGVRVVVQQTLANTIVSTIINMLIVLLPLILAGIVIYYIPRYTLKKFKKIQ